MTQADKMNAIQSINAALRYTLAHDDRVLVFGEDVADPEEGGVCGVTRGLSSEFGDRRVRSTPISEQAIMGAAIGASLGGYRPVVEIMLMNFTAVAMDMIANHAAKLRFMSGGQTNVPITIRCMTGSGYSTGGQHSDYLEAWFAHTAGIKVVAPSSPAEAYGLLLSCIEDDDPCLFIENMPTYWEAGDAPEEGVRIPLSTANIVRPGTDVTVVTYAAMVKPAMAAAESLAGEGISVELIDLRTIAPWDQQTVVESVGRTGRALVVHEAVREFGPGAEIASTVGDRCFKQLSAPVRRLGSAYCAVPFSKPLESAYAPDKEQIVAEIRNLMKSV